jgi:hypothetical protein
MFRVVITRPSVPVGTKGYKKQTLGIYLVDRDGVEDDFPSKMEILLGPDQADYPAGKYTIHPASFGLQADKYGASSLHVNRLRLSPVVEQATRKPAAA